MKTPLINILADWTSYKNVVNDDAKEHGSPPGLMENKEKAKTLLRKVISDL